MGGTYRNRWVALFGRSERWGVPINTLSPPGAGRSGGACIAAVKRWMAPIENFFWPPSAGVQAGMLAIRNDCVEWRKMGGTYGDRWVALFGR